MSTDIKKKEYVGVTLAPQIIEKIDERVTIYGGTRQDVIKNALIKDLFQSC